MKKLIVAAFAVVCCVFAASASQIQWGFYGETVDSNGDAFTGGTALLYVLTSATAAPVFKDGAWSMNGAILADYAPYNSDDLGWGKQEWVNGNGVNSGTTAGAEQQYFAVILTEKAGVTDLESYIGDDARYANVFMAQGEQKVVDPMGPTYGTWINNFDAGVAKGDWQTASAVPEPTSGLLLLLGVAGLALRRRRA